MNGILPYLTIRECRGAVGDRGQERLVQTHCFDIGPTSFFQCRFEKPLFDEILPKLRVVVFQESLNLFRLYGF